MNIIKFLLPLIVLICITVDGYGQLYINTFTGYSLSTNPHTIENRVIIDGSRDVFNSEFNYGKGMNLGMGIGYRINQNISFELSYNTQIFTKSEVNNDWEKYWQQTLSQENYSISVSGINGQRILKNRSLQIAPIFIYNIDLGEIQPYLKAGFNLLIVNSSYEKKYPQRHLTEDPNNPNIPYWETTYIEEENLESGKTTLGFRGAFGINYYISNQFSIYSEFMIINSSYNFTQSETTSYKVDGVDKLFEIENKIKEIKYDGGLIDYSHIGLNLGITFYIHRN